MRSSSVSSRSKGVHRTRMMALESHSATKYCRQINCMKRGFDGKTSYLHFLVKRVLNTSTRFLFVFFVLLACNDRVSISLTKFLVVLFPRVCYDDR